MALAGQRAQLLGRLRAAGRLAEETFAERQRLVRADDKLPGCRADTESAFSRARSEAISPGAERPEACCTARSSISPSRLEADAGIGQQRLPRATSRSQDQRSFSAPERHSASRCRCLSVNSFKTAAAVSSIDRRVTSSSAQLNLALNRRANATSSATA